MTGVVHAILPKAGLGNKLLVWARARAFADLNGLPLVVSGWHQLQLRTFLKGGGLRIYWNRFKATREVRLRLAQGLPRVMEPDVAPIVGPNSALYEFREMPHWRDYFGSIRPYRHLIVPRLKQMLTSARQIEAESAPSPSICVHVRLGDYRSLAVDEDFRQAGNARTPFEYFVEMIAALRACHGSEVPVTVVSDGGNVDLQSLLCVAGVNRGPKLTDLGDMLMMSKSGLLLCSAGSTFSLWAGFIGDGILLHHPDHLHSLCRPAGVVFEGAVRSTALWPEALVRGVRGLPGRGQC
jgi:hypothetical protein